MLENFDVKTGPKSDDLLQRNIKSYLDVFSSRQLLYLNRAIQILENYTGIEKLDFRYAGIHIFGVQFVALWVQRVV